MELQRVADDRFDLWFANKDSGLAGLSSFVGTIYACVSTFLSTHTIIATTVRQRLELALTAMRLLERHPIDERRFSRLCAADSDLSAIVDLHVDLNVFDSISVPPQVLERLAERCRVQADAVLVETPALSNPAEGFRGHRQHESILQSLKRLKQGMPLAVNELWNAHNGHFVDDTACMAKLIQDAAQDRQGRVTSSPLHGQNLLDQWFANFSQCRVIVERHEIVNIILDSPKGKKPGPDGLPAIIFQKAWIVFAPGRAPIDQVHMCLGFKKWIVVPKMEGANTIDKLRDLELGNEVRKVLARMLFKVLDEVCQHESHGLCHAQHAFVTGRDIIRNTTMLCRHFWAAHEEAAEGDDLYLLLALDCSKGYNRMDHSWLQRCLRAAWTKLGMLSAVGALYGTQLSLRDVRLSNVASVLSTHEAWIDIRDAGDDDTHFFPILPSVGRLRSIFSGILLENHTGSWSSSELHRWETYLEHRVQAKGWDGSTLRRTLRHLPRSVPQHHRWFLLKVLLNAPIA